MEEKVLVYDNRTGIFGFSSLLTNKRLELKGVVTNLESMVGNHLLGAWVGFDHPCNEKDQPSRIFDNSVRNEATA